MNQEGTSPPTARHRESINVAVRDVLINGAAVNVSHANMMLWSAQLLLTTPLNVVTVMHAPCAQHAGGEVLNMDHTAAPAASIACVLAAAMY